MTMDLLNTYKEVHLLADTGSLDTCHVFVMSITSVYSTYYFNDYLL